MTTSKVSTKAGALPENMRQCRHFLKKTKDLCFGGADISRVVYPSVYAAKGSVFFEQFMNFYSSSLTGLVASHTQEAPVNLFCTLSGTN